ncbi:MAG: ATP-dependent DNA helicase DinG [Oceanospirillaceae bacterium]|nr:ATP-dependent DNA helicase DinG [Oceanospirillaceae bacterium]MCP5349444.1 ATP-dependent DNA helicase DinG [Oceanospirillaceae bacterium]
MLNSDVRAAIQGAYSVFLKSKNLKPRSGQKNMIAEIARTLGSIQQDGDGKRIGDQPYICVVEAGTGTGKTLSYLLSVLPLAEYANKRVVISTATVALQEQLINKDIPDVRKNAGLEFRYVLAKGRGRYVCLSKLDAQLKDQRMQDAAMDLFAQSQATASDRSQYELFMDAFGAAKWSGDRDAWPEKIPDDQWFRVTATHRECTNRRCPHFNACPFFSARKALDEAELIVANHDLVMADISLGGGVVLPDPANTLYVFDEGHHLPEKAIEHFACHVKLAQQDQLFKQITKAVDGLGKQCGTPVGLLSVVQQIPELLGNLTQNLRGVRQLLFSLDENLQYQEGITQHRFRMGVVPDELVIEAVNLNKAYNSLYGMLDKISDALKDSLNKEDGEYKKGDAERWYPAFGLLQARIELAGFLWLSYASSEAEDKPPVSRWMERYFTADEDDIGLFSSPILAAELLAKNLWSRCFGAVVTSATLTALGRFDRFRMKSGVSRDQQFAMIQSPFNYPELGTLVVPAAATEAGAGDAYVAQITQALNEVLSADESTLVLFTSRRMMNDVKNGLALELAEHVLTQDDLSKQEVIRRHKEKVDDKQASILFGLASFAEGIDLPGNYLQHVVIVRLPFSVPDDPVDATLAEWLESKGRNPFMEISVPDASVRLIQACGRLIRTETDRGKITILDKRIVSKRYGQLLLDALPPFKREIKTR